MPDLPLEEMEVIRAAAQGLELVMLTLPTKPLFFMTIPPYSHGCYALHLGRAGLLVPDLPLEETEVIRNAAQGAGLELVMLTTPTTPIERAKRIAAASQGFVYLVSVAGGPALLWSDPICYGEAAGMS